MSEVVGAEAGMHATTLPRSWISPLSVVMFRAMTAISSERCSRFRAFSPPTARSLSNLIRSGQDSLAGIVFIEKGR
jgi:hypothetical protein